MRLRQARQDAGLTQRQLSFEGCTAAYVSRIEAGARVPSLQILREFAKRLGVSTDWLATGEESTDPVRLVQQLVQEAADHFPKDEQEIFLFGLETQLREMISQRERETEAERRRQTILEGMRQTLECGGVPEDQIEEVLARANETLDTPGSS